jgi:ABC-2 type transport system permease protein
VSTIRESTREHEPQESRPLEARRDAAVRVRRIWRLVTVLTEMEIKLRYADSALGYVWTIGKPLSLFSILYVVFGRLARFGSPMPHYALYLVIGVMLWAFFAEGVTRTMSSLVASGPLLRKLPFPRLVIPLSASLTALITFGLSVVAVGIFIAANALPPRLEWLVLLPEIVELYLFILGLGLILAVFYVRLRDVTQIWDLVVQLLFFLSPIIYPFTIVPARGRELMLLNPFTQVMQDVRALILYPQDVIAAPAAFSPLRLLPLAAAAFVLVVGVLLFKREEPWLAERV